MATRSSTASTKLLLASAVAGLMALNAFGGPAMAADKTDDGKVKCYGANSCKGSGACGGAGPCMRRRTRARGRAS